MCKQTQHPFQEVCQEKQYSSRIINEEYRINVTQFRITIHTCTCRYKNMYCRKIKYCIFVSKSRNFKTTFIPNPHKPRQVFLGARFHNFFYDFFLKISMDCSSKLSQIYSIFILLIR
jgi:hypothetical protein